MGENDFIHLKKGEAASKYSIIANISLAIIKGIVGVFSGSIALLADAVHSFSDIFTSLAVYIGLKLSQRKPDEKFPYGYYKFETLASLIISVIIIISGFEITIESINGILTPKPIGIPLFAISVTIISVVISFFLSKYKDKVGTEIGSRALINDGQHSFVDVFSSLIVFAGILGAYIGYPFLQGVAGLVVALLILYIGLKFGREAILVFLDANLDPKTVEKIKSIATNTKGVEGVHDIKVRRSGPYVFAELHLETKNRLSIEKASQISKNLKKRIINEINDLDSITIQIEPGKKMIVRVAVPVDKDEGLKSNISQHFAKAPYFLIVDLDKEEIKNFQLKINPAKKYERKRGLKTVEFLKNEDVDILLFNGKVNEGPSYALSDGLIDIISTNERKLEDMILSAIKKYE